MDPVKLTIVLYLENRILCVYKYNYKRCVDDADA